LDQKDIYSLEAVEKATGSAHKTEGSPRS